MSVSLIVSFLFFTAAAAAGGASGSGTSDVLSFKEKENLVSCACQTIERKIELSNEKP